MRIFIIYFSSFFFFFFFFFNDTATTEIYTLSLHDALPISRPPDAAPPAGVRRRVEHARRGPFGVAPRLRARAARAPLRRQVLLRRGPQGEAGGADRAPRAPHLHGQAGHRAGARRAPARAVALAARGDRQGRAGGAAPGGRAVQDRPDHRHGGRVPRAARRDGARLRPARRGAPRGGRGHLR